MVKKTFPLVAATILALVAIVANFPPTKQTNAQESVRIPIGATLNGSPLPTTDDLPKTPAPTPAPPPQTIVEPAKIVDSFETEIRKAADVRVFGLGPDEVAYAVLEPQAGSKKAFFIEIEGEVEDILVFRHNPGNTPPILPATEVEPGIYLIEGDPGTTFTLWLNPVEGSSTFKSYTFSGKKPYPDPDPDPEDPEDPPPPSGDAKAYAEIANQAASKLDAKTVRVLMEAYEKVLARPPPTIEEARKAFVDAYGNADKADDQPWYTTFRVPLEEQFKRDKPALKEYLSYYQAIVDAWKKTQAVPLQAKEPKKVTLRFFSPEGCENCDKWQRETLPYILRIPGVTVKKYRGSAFKFQICKEGYCFEHEGYLNETDFLSLLAKIRAK